MSNVVEWCGKQSACLKLSNVTIIDNIESLTNFEILFNFKKIKSKYDKCCENVSFQPRKCNSNVYKEHEIGH